MSSVAIPLARTVFARDSVSTLRTQIESSLGEQLSSTLWFRERAPAPTVSTGIAVLDTLTGGLPRGALSEFVGTASSGRTGAMMAILAGATQREEVCALVDASDSFDPASAAAAGVNLDRLLWVRCNEPAGVLHGKKRSSVGLGVSTGFAFSNALEQVLKVTDLLLQGGGFGIVVLDLGDIPPESARRIPLTSWFRFRRAVEPTATVLLLVEQEPCAKTCASLVVRLHPVSIFTSDSSARCVVSPDRFSEAQKVEQQREFRECSLPYIPQPNAVGHADLFRGMRLRAELVRSGGQRKRPQSANMQFELRAAL